MALTAELQLSTGEILVIDENEIKAINKWLDFKESQMAAADEVDFYRNAEGDPREEDHFKVSVDPFDEDHWDSILKGFLAAHGIVGWRNMAIAAFVYYTPIRFNFPEKA